MIFLLEVIKKFPNWPLAAVTHKKKSSAHYAIDELYKKKKKHVIMHLTFFFLTIALRMKFRCWFFLSLVYKSVYFVAQLYLLIL